ncbi:MlaD family protein [Raoultella planticola]|uniref:PqiB family protein n=1 Tax=Raoultella planticola TaxID=575 RepID=UPI001C9DA8EB|nr:MlaD family protein [Raoultella planticola]MDM9677863.1 MlaD family protein [Raoultella planticola]QZS62166.1 MlaD family protein [Raoultella planticola]
MKQTLPGNPKFIRTNWRNILLWLVPVIALLTSLSILVQTKLTKGPEITISFRSAAGLEAGKTTVKYKDVTVGIVKEIILSADNSAVLARVQLAKSAESLIRKDTRFWVVRPRVGISGVSGIDTLLSGPYIGMDKGKSVESRREFYGLETPPTLIGDVHGSQFTIEAADLGSLDIGSPIYYRRVQVGRVASYHLREDGAGIILKVFIDAPYDRLVTSETRFWNVSGIDLSVGADGVRLKTQTIATILAGGIAFASTAHGNPQRNGENIRYTLASDEASALAQPDGPAISFRLRFERSLRGLVIGAPVQFSSVVIGRVTSINLDYNPAGYRFPTIVEINVYPSRIGQVLAKLPHPTKTDDEEQIAALFVRDLVSQGLRAQAVPSNLLTGQLFITFDFIPDAPKVPFDLAARPLQLPTVNSGLDKIQDQIAGIATKVNKLPLESIGNNLDNTLAELSKTLRMVNRQTLPAANQLIKQTQKTTEGVQDLMEEDSPLISSIMQVLEESRRAFRSLRGLSDQLDRHPESLLRGAPQDPTPEFPAQPAHSPQEKR